MLLLLSRYPTHHNVPLISTSSSLSVAIFSGSTAWETAKNVTSQKSMKFNKQIGIVNLEVIKILFQKF